nr:MAG: hypothetical protein CM15mV30_0600 [uncultured marine virus]
MIEKQKEYELSKDKNLIKDISRLNNIQMARRLH